jgi:ribosomal RNA-processing protein 12
VIRPLISLDGDPALQKRAYRVLAALCEYKAPELLTPETLDELMPLLSDSLVTCHVAGRRRIIHWLVSSRRHDCSRRRCALTLTPAVLCPLSPRAARQMRLRVLDLMVQNLGGQAGGQSSLLASLLGEVLLCLKDANSKAREAAYQLLLTMARARPEPDMAQFSQMVLGALAANTPAMRSAAVRALPWPC